MKSLLSATALAAAALLASAPASAAPSFTFTASDTHIAIGGTTTVTATISGLNGDILSAFDLNFVYDGTILDIGTPANYTYNSAPLIDVISTILGLEMPGFANGNLAFADAAFDEDAVIAAGQPDSFVLFTFTLTGLDDGSTTFTLGANPFFDRNFVGVRYESQAVSVGSICIAVGLGDCGGGGQTPEPGTYGLAALGLLAAGAARRRARK